jgi:hypothetical protein
LGKGLEGGNYQHKKKAVFDEGRFSFMIKYCFFHDILKTVIARHEAISTWASRTCKSALYSIEIASFLAMTWLFITYS